MRVVEAPDYVDPTVGWRVWDLLEQGGGIRLCSPAFRTIWLPLRETVALCRRSLANISWAGLPDHSAPYERCSCGIYATRTAAQAAPYLSRLFKRRKGVLHRVIGRVSLWGSVVECECGWRASRAYPAVIYVPAPRRRRLSFFTGLPRPLVPVEKVALALADYGVPVEVVDCTTTRDMATALEGTAKGSSEWREE